MKQTILKRLEEEFSSRITNTKPYIYAWSENISMDAVLSFLGSELILFEREVREKTLAEVSKALKKRKDKLLLAVQKSNNDGHSANNKQRIMRNRLGIVMAIKIVDQLNTSQEEYDKLLLHECPKGIWDGKRHSKRLLDTSQEEEER